MANIFAENHCKTHGHDIRSLEVGKPTAEPLTKTIVYERELRCIKCGLAAGQIIHYSPAKPRRESNVGQESGSPTLA